MRMKRTISIVKTKRKRQVEKGAAVSVPDGAKDAAKVERKVVTVRYTKFEKNSFFFQKWKSGKAQKLKTGKISKIENWENSF